jgi:hypothetical protein
MAASYREKALVRHTPGAPRTDEERMDGSRRQRTASAAVAC